MKILLHPISQDSISQLQAHFFFENERDILCFNFPGILPAIYYAFKVALNIFFFTF